MSYPVLGLFLFILTGWSVGVWFIVQGEREQRMEIERRYGESLDKVDSIHQRYLKHIKELEEQAISQAVSKSGDEYRETLAVHQREPNKLQSSDETQREITSLGDLPEAALEDLKMVAQNE